MKIKEIHVDVKLSHNYNSYSCGETIQIEEGDNIPEVKKEAFRRCKAEAERQIQVEGL